MPKNSSGRIAKAACITVLLCLCSGSAFADLAFNIEGSTTGELYNGLTSVGTSYGGLSFNGASFGPTTSAQVTLGTFTLASTTFSNLNPLDFKLSVEFVAPSAGGTTFTADVNGVVFFGKAQGGTVT